MSQSRALYLSLGPLSAGVVVIVLFSYSLVMFLICMGLCSEHYGCSFLGEDDHFWGNTVKWSKSRDDESMLFERYVTM